jgi:hypothetical protein
MAYTPVTINTGDDITAAWANKVETNLVRIGNYRGVVAGVSSLPDIATIDEGDWYWCKSERLAKIKASGAYVSLNAAGEVASSAPTTATGILWYDTTNKILKIYNGSAWIPIGESVIDTSQAISSLHTALLAQNPTLLIGSIMETSLWNSLLKNSTVRAEVIKYKMYLDVMLGVGGSNLALDTDMEDAILSSIDSLAIALAIPSFWLNSDFLDYWLDNYFTKNNFLAGTTAVIASMNSKYGFRITNTGHYLSNFPYLSVDLDLTDFDDLDFWYSYTESGSAHVYLYIGADLKTTWTVNGSGTYNVDISGYSGVQTVKFLWNDGVVFDITDLTLS